MLTKARTADELLQNMGVTLKAGDAVTCCTSGDTPAVSGLADHMDAQLTGGTRVTVDSAFPVAVSADGGNLRYIVCAAARCRIRSRLLV